MAKGGIIMDVTTAEEARVAENAGVGFEIISLLLIFLLQVSLLKILNFEQFKKCLKMNL